MRLIDADAIKLEKGFFENVDNVPKFFEWLGKQPTIDPAKRGKWLYLDSDDVFECSVCGRLMVRNIFYYCPWCGAIMRGEENDNM